MLNIIKQIIKSAKEQDINIPAKTRLIKLLYLIEIEYYKHYQKRLTDLKWQFYHYGPYTSEIESILGSPDIEEEIPFVLGGGKLGSQYDLVREEVEVYLSSDIRRLIDHVVKEWGDIDLNKLLDYVYFETEPMRDAKRGELLDFTKIKPWEPPEKVKDVRIDRKKLSALKNEYLPHIKKISKIEPILQLTDKGYVDCIKVWDDEISNIRLAGQVTISLENERKDVS
ncbi:MAG: Panacea domain-containing protein [Nitrospirota bacterium]